MNGVEPTDESTASTQPIWPAWVMLFALLISWSLFQATIPGVNEPHYLTKSRHVWNPQWCAGDLFLESSNPHLVFYRTVGSLAYLTHFPIAALIGRVLAYALVAYGWTRLARVLTGHPATAVLSGSLFLLIATIGNWSGEWLVGGVESKVFAYGFAFWSAARLYEGRIAAAGLLAGLAFSFHPVVGAWFTLAISVAVCGHCLGWARVDALQTTPTRGWMSGGLLFAIAAAPGLIPVLSVLSTGTPAEALEATRYQVTKRLAHHLNPMRFKAFGYSLMAGLIVVGAGLSVLRRKRLAAPLWNFEIAVAASLLFAGVGVLLGLGLPDADISVKLLKFYPFRLADILVPWTVSLLLAGWLYDVLPKRALMGITLVIAACSLALPAHDRDSSHMATDVKEAWGDACWWIRSETRPNSLILAADTRWAFKWFGQRPEYVNHKDCPQDPKSIAEFRRRLRVLYDWSTAAMSDRMITAEELQALRRETGIDYLITYRFGTFRPAPVYQNEFFRVYALPDSAE